MHDLRFLNGKLQERRQMVPGGLWNEWTDVQSIASPEVSWIDQSDPKNWNFTRDLSNSKPKDSSVGEPKSCLYCTPACYGPLFSKCVCGCHKKDEKPKDSEVWCEHIFRDYTNSDTQGKWTFKDKPGTFIDHRDHYACGLRWNSCPICGTPRPKPDPVKTLAEKIQEAPIAGGWLSNSEAIMFEKIAREHFKQV